MKITHPARIGIFAFKNLATAALAASLLLSAGARVFAESATLTVDVDKPGIAVSPTLYGIFFEEINRAGDGGIYAEMIQNRSFEDADFPVAWSPVKSGDAEATISLDKSKPLNAKNPTSLKLEITKIAAGARAGVANDGFKGVAQRPPGQPDKWRAKWDEAVAKSASGIAVTAGKEYDLSLYSAAQNFSGPLDVTIEKQDGTVLASGEVSGIGEDWKKFTLALKASASDTNARLVISAKKTGTVWLDMVSLFPRETWKGRANGLRSDLMEMIAAMHPAFVRFPGGCFVEGDKLSEAARWKESVGDIAERPGHYNLWGYRSTDGLGFYEYLQMCEDLGAEPLFVVNCGMSHEEQRKSHSGEPVPVDPSFVQDALDAIEYANGPADSKWGALRAKAGHPKPFHLKLMEIGNENGGPLYYERYALFHDAIKAKYPDMQLIACEWHGIPKNRPLDLIDQHDYNTPQSFRAKATRYDSYDRSGPKVYFGEYAVTRGDIGRGNLRAAVAEAAFMTGLERNSDVVRLSSYAPLLVEPSWATWNPNAIIFDNSRVYGTPSYYVQAMFAGNRGDVNLPVSIVQPDAGQESYPGMIGVGTWNTQAEFKDIKVTKNGATLFASDFSKNIAGWDTTRGKWEAADGVLRQSGDEADVRAVTGDRTWSDYTLSLKARKTGGKEGVLIIFQSSGDWAKSWWNIGGMDNTRHQLEIEDVPQAPVPGSLETGRWYDIRVELSGVSIKCYLDGKLVHDVKRQSPNALFAVAGHDNKTGEVVVKVANAADRPLETEINLRGAKTVAPEAKSTVLTSGSVRDENSFDDTKKVSPRDEAVTNAAEKFTHTFPANSVTVLRLKATP
jgi:alpha-L-arabinofuranosidase